jgi:hypothetical protein
MANLGEPVRIHEVEPLEEPVTLPDETTPTELPEPVEDPEYAPI